MGTISPTARDTWVTNMISNNIFISYLLFLIKEDIIDLTNIDKNIIRSPLHMLVASICIIVINLGVSSGNEEVDKVISKYRNSIIHCEGSISADIPYCINTIVDNIIEKFIIDENINHMYFNNYRKEDLEWKKQKNISWECI